jgi:hypothetical protein
MIAEPSTILPSRLRLTYEPFADFLITCGKASAMLAAPC